MRLALVLAVCLAAPAVAQAPVFDEAERQAIREEVRAFLLENPDILQDMIGLLEEEQAVAQEGADLELITTHADDIFADGFSHVGGNPEGDVTVVEFLDYQCGFCRRAHPELQALLERDGNIRLVTKEYPILGPGSELASRAAVATLIEEGAEAYERLGTALMGVEGQITDASLDAALREAGLDPAPIRDQMNSEEVSRRLAETRTLGQTLGVSGTPTFIFEDQILRGYLPLEAMEALVGTLREAS